MLFKFLKYTNPINYFNLVRKNGKTVFPDWEKLPIEVQNKIDFDENYSSIKISNLDASWQAIQKGYIGNADTVSFDTKIPLIDEYRFIRKYYSKVWVYYTLILRILTLHNPFKEIIAFIKTKNIRRINVYDNPLKYEDWDNFESNLLKKKPKVSVIIPTLNRYKYLKDALLDLEKQTYKNFEVIIVDQSDTFVEKFYVNFKLNIKLYKQKEKALWKARNYAIKKANGEFIALYEDDVRVNKSWLKNHIKTIDFFNADISSGVFFPENSKIPPQSNFFTLAKQFATGNAFLYKKIFKKIGLFDRQFEKQRMGDGEFGLRAYLNGFKNIHNPLAYCVDVKAETGGLRHFGSWDAFRNKKILGPKPVPSVLYMFRKYYGSKSALFDLFKTIPKSIVPYKYKRNKKILILGSFLSILIFPFVFFQVFKSWRLASKKIKKGDLIEKF